MVLSDFTEHFFSLPEIQCYTTRGKTNVLICDFEYDEAQAVSTPTMAPPLSQLSQISQMSQYLVDMGGYPFGMSYGMTLNLPYETKETIPMGYGFGTMGPEM
jgi:hypothetical protein